MAKSFNMISKTTSHTRSYSLPSIPNSSSAIDILLLKFSTLEIKCSSKSSATSICKKLCVIKNLCQSIENSIQCPSNQQALSLRQHRVVVEEVLEGSLSLLDVCAFIIDILSSIKESISEFESCLRRKHGSKDDMHAYLMSRKKIHKRVSKYVSNLHVNNVMNYEKGDNNSDIIDVVRMLKEGETLSLSTLKHVLAYFSRPKEKLSGWKLLAKLTTSKHIACDKQEDTNEFEKIDQIIRGLESKKSAATIDVEVAQDLSKQLASLE